MHTTTQRAFRSTSQVTYPDLACAVRDSDGHTSTGHLPAEDHARLWFSMLHGQHAGLVELAAGKRATVPNDKGKLALDVYTRKNPAWFSYRGGLAGDPDWQTKILNRINDAVANRREEAFAGVTERVKPVGTKDACEQSQVLWVDIDEPDRLPAFARIWAPPHMVIESGGSGGQHAYWLLDRPLAARATVTQPDGQVTEEQLIEAANLRLISHFGGDRVARDCVRVMRIAGTPNWKTGAFSRIVYADFHRPRYTLEQVIGVLPDPAGDQAANTTKIVHRAPSATGQQSWVDDLDAQVSAHAYFQTLLGLTVNRASKVRCPAHDDSNPSCHVFEEPGRGWHCYSCGAGGGIVAAAAIAAGHPGGRQVRGDVFKDAKRLLWERYGSYFPQITNPGL